MSLHKPAWLFFATIEVVAVLLELEGDGRVCRIRGADEGSERWRSEDETMVWIDVEDVMRTLGQARDGSVVLAVFAEVAVFEFDMIVVSSNDSYTRPAQQYSMFRSSSSHRMYRVLKDEVMANTRA